MNTATATRFVRRTQLAPGEYRKNFHQVDREVVEAITSAEADRVTPLMSKIYLRLVNAPSRFFEREGVLRFGAEERDGQLVKSWLVLCELLGVSSATANKALSWLHEQGVIGYFAGKNGVGIRIFLNRASSSIGKKILPFRPVSPGVSPVSPGETAFIDSYAVLESSEKDFSRRTPRCGARGNTQGEATPTPDCGPGRLRPQPSAATNTLMRVTEPAYGQPPAPHEVVGAAAIAKEVVALEMARERESMRDWLEKRGLPKVARVVQREVLDTLRRNGLLKDAKFTGERIGRAQQEVSERAPRQLTAPEVLELAAACVSMFEVQGRPVEQTISEMALERGGFVLEQDLSEIERAAREIIAANGGAGEENSAPNEKAETLLPSSSNISSG